MEKERQGVVHVLLNGIKIMEAAVLLIKHIVLRREGPTGEYFLGHIDALAFHGVLRPDRVIDEVPPLVEVVILHKRLEEVQVRIVPRGQGTSTTVNYRVHRQDYGWESVWKTNGQESGTTGESKRLEGIEIHLSGNEFSGGIKYRTHVQNIGWESSWSQNGEMSGTQGLAYRLEAIQIELTGDIANYYDVYYRVHAQDFGWLGWAKNGEVSGTSGLSKRLEAIQIVLVKKGESVPGDINGVTSVTGYAAVSDSPMPTPAPTSAPVPTGTIQNPSNPTAEAEPIPDIYKIPDYKVNPYYLPSANCIGQIWEFDGYVDSNVPEEQTDIFKEFLFPLDYPQKEIDLYAIEAFFAHGYIPTHYACTGYLYDDGTIRNFPDRNGGAIGSWLSDDGSMRISRAGYSYPVTWNDPDYFLNYYP